MNQSTFPRLISLSFAALLALTATAGTAQTAPDTTEAQNSWEDTPFDNVRGAAWDTADGRYVVHLDDVPAELKSGAVQTWCVRVNDPNGKSVRGIRLDFIGGMPQHGHGLPAVPATTQKAGKCPYRIDGIEFHMPGVWQVGFTITTRSGSKHEVRRFVNVH